MIEALGSLGALGVVALPLLGVWLGQRLQGRTGHEAWLRDKRLEVYVDALAFLDEHGRFSTNPEHHEPDGWVPGVAGWPEADAEHMRRHGALSARLGLLGPAQVGTSWGEAVTWAGKSRQLLTLASEARRRAELDYVGPGAAELADAGERQGETRRAVEDAMQEALRDGRGRSKSSRLISISG